MRKTFDHLACLHITLMSDYGAEIVYSYRNYKNNFCKTERYFSDLCDISHILHELEDKLLEFDEIK